MIMQSNGNTKQWQCLAMAMLSNGNARQLSTIFPNLSFPRTQHHGTWFWQEQVHTVRRPPQVPQYTYACQTTKTPYHSYPERLLG